MNWWLERHLGFGLSNPAGLLGISSSLTLGSMILDWLVKNEEQEAAKSRLLAWLRWPLERPWLPAALVMLYLGFLVLAISTSALVLVDAPAGVVIRDFDGTPVHVQAKAGPTERILLATSPFGRTLRLSAPGYLEQTLTLHPLTGLTITVAQDLRPLPSLLVRPTPEGLSALQAGASILLFKIGEHGCKLIADAVAWKAKTSFMVGPERAIGAGSLALWSLELGAPLAGQGDPSETLLAWNRPTVLATLEVVEPGDQIYAVVAYATGSPVDDALAKVGSDGLQDVPMFRAAGLPSCAASLWSPAGAR